MLHYKRLTVILWTLFVGASVRATPRLIYVPIDMAYHHYQESPERVDVYCSIINPQTDTQTVSVDFINGVSVATNANLVSSGSFENHSTNITITEGSHYHLWWFKLSAESLSTAKLPVLIRITIEESSGFLTGQCSLMYDRFGTTPILNSRYVIPINGGRPF